MQPSKVHGDVIKKGRTSRLLIPRSSPLVSGDALGGSRLATSPRAQPYNLQEAMLRRAVSRTQPLLMSGWNGHIEITDECKLGLALLQIASPRKIIKHMTVPFKNTTRSKRVEIHLIDDITRVSTYLFRNNHSVTITDVMLRHMGDKGLEQYLTEYSLVSQLLDKIMRVEAVRDRWIPTFSPPLRTLSTLLNQELEVPLIGSGFEISGGYVFQPRTLGQWFLKLSLERVRRQVKSGIGLRGFLYCICWCARLISEHDYDRLRASAAMIKAWLLQGTCQDCLYKFLRELREDVAFEYILNIADSFSDCFTLPDLRTSLRIGKCGDDATGAESQPGFLRTFGRHSFLTSPYANTCLPVQVRLFEDQEPKTFKMTGRQTASVLVMLDLHSRVLRARAWRQCRRAFLACLRERRVNDGNSLVSVMSQIVEDMRSLSLMSSGLATTVAHFAPLIFTGRLSVEMLGAYNQAKDHENVSAQRFIVNYCFLRAPTPDTQAYADKQYSDFLGKSADERRAALEYTIEHDDFEYELSEIEVDLEERWNIVGSLPEEALVNEYSGEQLVFYNALRASRSSSSLGHAPSTSDITELDEASFRLAINDKDRASLTSDEIAMLVDSTGDRKQPNLLDPAAEVQEPTHDYEESVPKSESFSEFRDPAEVGSISSGSTVVEPDDASSIGYSEIARDAITD